MSTVIDNALRDYLRKKSSVPADVAQIGQAVSRAFRNGYVSGAKSGASEEAEKLLEAVLLFYNSQPWNEEMAAKWFDLTGENDCTSAALCRRIRHALSKIQDKHPILVGV